MITPTILPPNYEQHELNCLSAGAKAEASMWEFLDAVLMAKRELGEAYYQLHSSICRKLKIQEKTLKNYVGTYENALDGQWHVPQLSIAHHTAADLKALDPGDKEQVLTAAFENCLPVPETRALAKEMEAQKLGLPSPIEKEMTAMEELQEALDKEQLRNSEAAVLLRECKPLTEGDLHARIEEWELGS